MRVGPRVKVDEPIDHIDDGAIPVLGTSRELYL